MDLFECRRASRVGRVQMKRRIIQFAIVVAVVGFESATHAQNPTLAVLCLSNSGL